MFGSSGRTSKGTHCLKGLITAMYHKYRQLFKLSVSFCGRFQTKLDFGQVQPVQSRCSIGADKRTDGQDNAKCPDATAGILSDLGNIRTDCLQNKRTKFVTARRQF